MLLRKKIDIFLTSFLILFLELVLIRFLPAQISYLGYYSNFLLLATFVGIGAGVLLARNERNFMDAFPWFLLFLVAFTSVFSISVYPDSNGEIHFTSTFKAVSLPETFLVPIIFFIVVIVFTLISQKLGRLLNALPPLTAYTFDILGSITGIVIFTVLSYFRTGPIVWFGIFSSIFLISIWKETKKHLPKLLTLTLTMVLLIPSTIDTLWSPYQKITVSPYSFYGQEEATDYQIFVNNISHQSMARDIWEKEWVYKVPYEIFNSNKFEKALIIGAGAGNDVSVAVANGVSKIDAVEIDPEIYRTGVRLHPNMPYQNQNVSVYIDDARSFLQKNKTKYDLIIFGLPDSLLLASSRGNIRLESFLFTKEAFESAKEHLNSNGLIVLYNYYRKPWLIAKLAGMLDDVFGRKSYVLDGGTPLHLGVLMNGEKLNDLRENIEVSVQFEETPLPSTDDWPFLYLKDPSIPFHYIVMLGVIGFLIYFFLSHITSMALYKTVKPAYFFLGAGFLLLETKSVIQFALLFGATWLTNALTFFAILVSILAAIHVAKNLVVLNLRPLYLFLVLSLAIQYLIPLRTLLSFSPALKYGIVSFVTFSPIFFANLIFAYMFKESKNNSLNFASNLLGAAFGGILEYTALLAGYRNLILVITLCYILTFSSSKINKFLVRIR